VKRLTDKALARLRDSSDAPDLAGTRYRLLGQVARGGMGVVYSAEDAVLGRRVALKVLDLPGDQNDLAGRLRREARVLALLEHPGVVPVHDVGTLPDGRVFYAMKFVEGQSLDQCISAVTSTPDRLRMFLRVCDALAFAHARNVLHRDLKPTNIMVGPFGEVLVMDWGLAKILDHSEGSPSENCGVAPPSMRVQFSGSNSTQPPPVTAHGTVLGTPGYMSPEQERGDVGSLDARSDIFSLGAVLRFLVNADSSLPDRSLEAICGKATHPDPAQRYASVQDLAADVSRYLDGLAVAAHRESFFEKAARFYRRYRFFILLIAAYLIMRVLLLLLLKR